MTLNESEQPKKQTTVSDFIGQLDAKLKGHKEMSSPDHHSDIGEALKNVLAIVRAKSETKAWSEVEVNQALEAVKLHLPADTSLQDYGWPAQPGDVPHE